MKFHTKFYAGVLAYDIQFYLNFLINKERLIEEDDFNFKLKKFLLSERDARNRPKEFKKRKPKSKYEGNAGSLRVLSRIVTMLLTSVLDQSKVGPLLIKLQEVAELITAPKLTVDEIDDILGFTIKEYLGMRVDAIDELGMDNLRPKHHYLSHYSKFYKENGPLIQLWAMRMESKHVFFKNVIR